MSYIMQQRPDAVQELYMRCCEQQMAPGEAAQGHHDAIAH